MATPIRTEIPTQISFLISHHTGAAAFSKVASDLGLRRVQYISVLNTIFLQVTIDNVTDVFGVFRSFQSLFRVLHLPQVVQKHTLDKVEYFNFSGLFMTSCVRHICSENYKNLIIRQVTIDNVGVRF